jgi:hypothetical protein
MSPRSERYDRDGFSTLSGSTSVAPILALTFADALVRAHRVAETGWKSQLSSKGARAVYEQFPLLASNLGPKLGTTSRLRQTNVFRGDISKRAGWSDQNMQAWQLFFDEMKAEDACSNVLIAGANAFDRGKVKGCRSRPRGRVGRAPPRQRPTA